MAVRCSYCGRDYDVTLFEFNRSVTCVCGETVTFKHEAPPARRDEDSRIREITAMADRISTLIVDSNNAVSEIEMDKLRLKEMISELFPDKTYLYDLIYERRFRKLTEQFGKQDIKHGGGHEGIDNKR